MTTFTYGQYTNSNIAYLGSLPSHWSNAQVGKLFEIGRGRVISHEEIQNNPGIYPVYSSQTENSGCMGEISSFDFEGDYLTWTTDGANAGTVFQRYGKFNCTNVCGTLRPKSDDFVLNYFVHAIGISTAYFVRHDINPKLMNNVMARIRVPLPPLPEQRSIAAFLDAETSKIDALVAEQRRLIELLKEKRQAVISQAVTKGLNPHAKMKPSGIDWLGDVPEHWVRAKLKQVVTYRKGTAFKAEAFSDSGIAVVKASDIKDFTIREPASFLPNEYGLEFPRSVLQSGEIVLSTVGSTPEVKNSAVGQIGRVPLSLHNSLLNQNTVVFSPLPRKISPDFLFFLLQCRGYRDHLDIHAHGTANQASLNVSDMLSFEIALPTIVEQTEIACLITNALLQLRDLASDAEQAISLLQERRTALISAAVTGKIDVQGFVPKEASV